MAIISFYSLKIIFGHFTLDLITELTDVPVLMVLWFFSGGNGTKWPIWGHHTQIHRFYGIKRWNTMRKKISNFHKPRKKLSRHAHESIKPRLWQIRALEVGAEKKSQ
mgnify:CR=1 FL=1